MEVKLPFGEIGTLELGLLGITPGPGGNGRVVFNLAPNYKNNHTVQASFSIAREIGPSLSFEVAHLMYRSIHIQLTQETNYRETGVTDPTSYQTLLPKSPVLGELHLEQVH